MALIGSVSSQGSLQGQINSANGYLTGLITDAGLMGGQVVGMRGLKGDKGDKGDTGSTGATGQDGHSPVVTASKAGSVTTVYVDGSSIATINDGTNGTNGTDGHSPVITATKSAGTTTIKSDGTTIGTVLDGDDYILTSQDKQDIADIVLADFPTWNGGNY